MLLLGASTSTLVVVTGLLAAVEGRVGPILNLLILVLSLGCV